MSFSFNSVDFQNALKRLFETAQQNLDSKDDEIKKWAHKVRSIKSLFTDINLFADKLYETQKWDLFNLNELAQHIVDDVLMHLKYGALSLFVYLKEWNFREGIRDGEDLNQSVRIFYDYIYTEKNQRYLEFKTHYDFVDELPYIICGEIYSDSRLNEIRKFLEEKDFGDYKDLIKESEEAADLIQGWNSTFEVKMYEVKELEKKLENYKTTYDFVLLNKGFQQLYDEKKKSLESQKKINSFWMFLVIFFPIINLYIGKYLSDLHQYNWLNILALVLPVITLIFICLYFYRIGLQERRSIQSQMMQLELRMALCQFIHNYAEDSETLHAKNKPAFKKFENIIFSPLVSSDDKIPTTFDGMEQLAKLVSEFRK